MRRALAIATMLLAAICATLDAYVFLGQVWPDGSIVMQMQLGSSSGTLLDGSTSWGQSAEGALATWNNYLSRVQFRVVRDSTAPTGDNNGYNNVFFSSSIYGRSFGSSTLAVTTNWYRVSNNARTEADVVFNTAFSWNSYSGPTRTASTGGNLYDLRRVALHEFGHVLGLDHPDEYGQSVAAIMNSRISDIDSLQADDVAGVRALYGGSAPQGPPGVPSGLATSSSGSSVFLAWNPPSSGGAPSAYIIEAGSSSGLTNLANFSTGNTATTFSAGGVGNGTYFVRVRAANGAGTSGASNESRLVVGSGGCTSAPLAPGGFATTFNSGGTVSFGWSASAGAATYVIEAGSSPGLTNLANSDLGSAAAAATFTGIGSGTYYVRLRARNACGTSAPSNEVTLVVGGGSPAPTLSIVSWSAQFSIGTVSGGYQTTGTINMTLNNAVAGTYRAEFNSYGFIGGTQTFPAATRTLSFSVNKITSACPDLHGTVPLYLYNSSNQIVAAVGAELHGTGCAFNPETGMATVTGAAIANPLLQIRK